MYVKHSEQSDTTRGTFDIRTQERFDIKTEGGRREKGLISGLIYRVSDHRLRGRGRTLTARLLYRISGRDRRTLAVLIAMRDGETVQNDPTQTEPHVPLC